MDTARLWFLKEKNERTFLSDSGIRDAFGHHQLGGVAPVIHHILANESKLKCHWAVSDYLQRSARHIASQTDFEQAKALGKAAIDFAIEGKNNVMLTINRLSTEPYSWDIGTTRLNANVKRPCLKILSAKTVLASLKRAEIHAAAHTGRSFSAFKMVYQCTPH